VCYSHNQYPVDPHHEGFQVNIPPSAKEEEVFNPLFAFCLPKSLGKGYPGARYNPTAAPNYLPPLQGNLPYTPEGYSTVRAPDGNCQTQVCPETAQIRLTRACEISHVLICSEPAKGHCCTKPAKGMEVQVHHLISLGGWNDVISMCL
jgi:hypothetical protein